MSSSTLIYGVRFTFEAVPEEFYSWDFSEALDDKLTSFVSRYMYDEFLIEPGNECVWGVHVSTAYSSYSSDYTHVNASSINKAKAAWEAFCQKRPNYMEKLLKSEAFAGVHIGDVSEPGYWLTHDEDSQSEAFLVWGMKAECFKNANNFWQVSLPDRGHSFDPAALNSDLLELGEDAIAYDPDAFYKVLERHLGSTIALMPHYDESRNDFTIIIGKRTASLLEGINTERVNFDKPKFKGKQASMTDVKLYNIVELYG